MSSAPTSAKTNQTSNGQTGPLDVLPSDVLANIRKARDAAVEQRLAVMEQAKSGGEDVFKLVEQANTLQRQIDALNKELGEKTTQNVAATADAIKAFCLSNDTVKAFYAAGGKTLYVRGDNGTITVSTVERVAKGPRKSGGTRTRTVIARWFDETFTDKRALNTRFGAQRDGETEAAWKSRLTADYKVEWV